jgi:hypothetical protein
MRHWWQHSGLDLHPKQLGMTLLLPRWSCTCCKPEVKRLGPRWRLLLHPDWQHCGKCSLCSQGEGQGELLCHHPHHLQLPHLLLWWCPPFVSRQCDVLLVETAWPQVVGASYKCTPEVLCCCVVLANCIACCECNWRSLIMLVSSSLDLKKK